MYRIILFVGALCACDHGKDTEIDVLSATSVDCLINTDGAVEPVTVHIGAGVVDTVEICDMDGECCESADWWMDGGQVIIEDCDQPDGWAVITYAR